MKVCHLCDSCNKEFEVPMYVTVKGTRYTSNCRCPFCNAINNLWLRIEA